MVILLLVGNLGHQPQLSRQEAIDAALSAQAQQTRHYAAKLVRESDLERAAYRSGENIGQDARPDSFIWVIAISGDDGIHGEYSGGPITWAIALINDTRPARLSGSISSGGGDWPPFFDRLVDLS